MRKMELRGIEPRTSHMRSEHSTSELQPLDKSNDTNGTINGSRRGKFEEQVTLPVGMKYTNHGLLLLLLKLNIYLV